MSVTPEMIKTARERLGETQAQFAKRFRVNQATVSRWEVYGPTDRGLTEMAIRLVLGKIKPER